MPLSPSQGHLARRKLGLEIFSATCTQLMLCQSLEATGPILGLCAMELTNASEVLNPHPCLHGRHGVLNQPQPCPFSGVGGHNLAIPKGQQVHTPADIRPGSHFSRWLPKTIPEATGYFTSHCCWHHCFFLSEKRACRSCWC